MNINKGKIDLHESKYQTTLFGYDFYFHSFVKLFKNKKLPNVILLSGEKGLGKSTFVYHFINYLLSVDEKNKYIFHDLKIISTNYSYNLIKNNIHPNLFLLESRLYEDGVKIEQVRNLLKFLSKSTYSHNIKIIMIDDAENLNLNSSNALLNALESYNTNTFFFIINSNSSKILNTIKSRAIEFKFFFKLAEKIKILEKLINQYELNIELENIKQFLYFDTPGNLLKYLLIFKDTNIDISKNKFECILYLVEKYKSKKDTELLTMASLFIEIFYNDLCKKKININSCLYNRHKILNEMNDFKKFNLDKKNLLVSLHNILANEKR